MRNLFLLAVVGVILIVGGVTNISSQEVTTNLTTDPAKAPFVYDDIRNFIAAYHLLESNDDTLGLLQSEYLDKGTAGLKIFIEKYGLTAKSLYKAMVTYPEKYASLPALLQVIIDSEPHSRQAYAKMKEFIPHIVYPPTYFVVGAHRGIGSGSVEGQLITVEKWSLPMEDHSRLLVHELTHFEQVVAVGYPKYKAIFGPEKNLLGLCIREGTAEFIATIVTKLNNKHKPLDYTIQHEQRLWKWFVKEMDGPETGDWLWSTPKDENQPQDVGYVIGMRIVESYYNQAEDKAKAIKEILGVTDYKAFLEKSGFARRFAKED